MKAPLKSLRSRESFGRDAASRMISSYYNTGIVRRDPLPGAAAGILGRTYKEFTIINDTIGKDSLAKVTGKIDIVGHASRLAVYVFSCSEGKPHEVGGLMTRFGQVEGSHLVACSTVSNAADQDDTSYTVCKSTRYMEDSVLLYFLPFVCSYPCHMLDPDDVQYAWPTSLCSK